MADGELVSIGCDWLTCSSDVLGSGEEIYDDAMKAIKQEERAGSKIRHFSLIDCPMTSCGEVAAGLNDEKALVQLSGSRAREGWEWYVERADHVSRFDMQATMRVDDPKTDYGSLAAVHAHLAAARSGKRPEVLRHGPVYGPTTCYVGKASSQIRLRLYNKTAESKGEWPPTCWRYEVQLRDEHALSAARSILHLDDLENEFLSAITTCFGKRGIHTMYRPVGSDWKDRSPVVVTDIDRRMAWLRNQVRPAIEWTLLHRSKDDILHALGLGPSSRSLREVRKELTGEAKSLPGIPTREEVNKEL